MSYDVQPSKQVVKYLKKIKEKKLREKFVSVIYDEIATNPYSGEQKSGDLTNIWTKGFIYQKTSYRIAYVIEEDCVIPILLAGTHENFYEQLKRFL